MFTMFALKKQNALKVNIFKYQSNNSKYETK